MHTEVCTPIDGLERSQRKCNRISYYLTRFAIGDLHKLLRPLIHNALGGTIPGQACQIDGADILHVAVSESRYYLAGLQIAQTAFERGSTLIDHTGSGTRTYRASPTDCV